MVEDYDWVGIVLVAYLFGLLVLLAAIPFKMRKDPKWQEIRDDGDLGTTVGLTLFLLVWPLIPLVGLFVSRKNDDG